MLTGLLGVIDMSSEDLRASLSLPLASARMSFSASVGVTASVAGLYLSYYFNLPSGPAIVLVVSLFFSLALLFSPSHGIWSWPRKSWF